MRCQAQAHFGEECRCFQMRQLRLSQQIAREAGVVVGVQTQVVPVPQHVPLAPSVGVRKEATEVLNDASPPAMDGIFLRVVVEQHSTGAVVYGIVAARDDLSPVRWVAWIQTHRKGEILVRQPQTGPNKGLHDVVGGRAREQPMRFQVFK